MCEQGAKRRPCPESDLERIDNRCPPLGEQVCGKRTGDCLHRAAPRLLSVETGPLAAALNGLRREVMAASDSALLPPWAFLVAAYARQMVRPEKGDVRLRRLWEEVGADLGRSWTVEALADRVGISGEHLRRLCQRHQSRSPMSHVVSLRMRQAMALLASDFCTIEIVAQKVGYDNPFAFSTAFKRYQGISPSEYRFKAHGPSNSD